MEDGHTWSIVVARAEDSHEQAGEDVAKIEELEKGSLQRKDEHRHEQLKGSKLIRRRARDRDRAHIMTINPGSVLSLRPSPNSGPGQRVSDKSSTDVMAYKPCFLYDGADESRLSRISSDSRPAHLLSMKFC